MNKQELMSTLEEVLIKFDKYREESEEVVEMYAEDLKAEKLHCQELEAENEILRGALRQACHKLMGAE